MLEIIAQTLFIGILAIGVVYALLLLKRKEELSSLFQPMIILCWAGLALVWLLIARYFGYVGETVFSALIWLGFITMPAALGIVAILKTGIEKEGK